MLTIPKNWCQKSDLVLAVKIEWSLDGKKYGLVIRLLFVLTNGKKCHFWLLLISKAQNLLPIV